MNDPLIEPFCTPVENSTASDVVSEPSEEFVDLTDNINVAAESAAAAASDETSDGFVDLLGSESEAQKGEVDVAGVTEKDEVIGSVADPPDYAKQETASDAPIFNLSGDLSANGTQQPPVTNKDAAPLVDLLNDAPPFAADEKKSSSAVMDLFEDDGSDIFTGPQLTKPAKQPQTDLFGEPDEDLFGEPLGAISKKTINEEPKEKHITTKAAVSASAGGPLQDGNPTEPADIFTEEAVATGPSTSNTNIVNSKANGLHSEEESDIFAGEFTIFIYLCLNFNSGKLIQFKVTYEYFIF